MCLVYLHACSDALLHPEVVIEYLVEHITVIQLGVLSEYAQGK